MINEIKIADYPDINWKEVFDNRERVQTEEYDEHAVYTKLIFDLDKRSNAPLELYGIWITEKIYYYNLSYEEDCFDNDIPEVIYRAEKRRMDRVDWCRKEMIT